MSKKHMIPIEDKVKFWDKYNHLELKDFAAKAREVLGYSQKTVPADIHSSICAAAYKSGRMEG